METFIKIAKWIIHEVMLTFIVVLAVIPLSAYLYMIYNVHFNYNIETAGFVFVLFVFQAIVSYFKCFKSLF